VKRLSKRARCLGPLADDLAELETERRNRASRDLDRRTALEIARIINGEDKRVPAAVAKALPAIARAIDAVAEAFRNGGRLFYVGTGTSGRLGALDASECPPTFNASRRMVQCVIAGGNRALGRAVEAAEDSKVRGRRELAARGITSHDVVCGLAASGRTPYTLAALEYARSRGATTICVTANPASPITRVAGIVIAVKVGPEVVAGSTRMKAGTMEKLVLNTITTGAFTRLGYVYGNLMINLHMKSAKLVQRAAGILQTLTGVGRAEALRWLERAGGSVPVAVLMQRAGLSRTAARKRLAASQGNLRRALANTQPTPR